MSVLWTFPQSQLVTSHWWCTRALKLLIQVVYTLFLTFALRTRGIYFTSWIRKFIGLLNNKFPCVKECIGCYYRLSQCVRLIKRTFSLLHILLSSIVLSLYPILFCCCVYIFDFDTWKQTVDCTSWKFPIYFGEVIKVDLETLLHYLRVYIQFYSCNACSLSGNQSMVQEHHAIILSKQQCQQQFLKSLSIIEFLNLEVSCNLTEVC